MERGRPCPLAARRAALLARVRAHRNSAAAFRDDRAKVGGALAVVRSWRGNRRTATTTPPFATTSREAATLSPPFDPAQERRRPL